MRSGLIRKSEVLALQRARANLQGEVGRLTGEIGDSKERIARSEEQIVGARNTVIKASVEQLHETLAELADVRERILASTRILDRVKISSPVKGVVVKLRYHTAGGVVEPGKTVMEIVPVQDNLLIEVRVRPQDIQNVKLGQPAIVRLTALKQRVTPMIEGHVVYVSADALPDDKGGPASRNDVYVARVAPDPRPRPQASMTSFRRLECPRRSTSRPLTGPSWNTCCSRSETACPGRSGSFDPAAANAAGRSE